MLRCLGFLLVIFFNMPLYASEEMPKYDLYTSIITQQPFFEYQRNFIKKISMLSNEAKNKNNDLEYNTNKVSIMMIVNSNQSFFPLEIAKRVGDNGTVTVYHADQNEILNYQKCLYNDAKSKKWFIDNMFFDALKNLNEARLENVPSENDQKKYNCIWVDNGVENKMNPFEHQNFLSKMVAFLDNGGTIYSTAIAMPDLFNTPVNSDLCDRFSYFTIKEFCDSLYWRFMQLKWKRYTSYYQCEKTLSKKLIGALYVVIINNNKSYKFQEKTSGMGFVIDMSSGSPVKRLVYKTDIIEYVNFFTKDIYRAAYKAASVNMQMEEFYYHDKNGTCFDRCIKTYPLYVTVVMKKQEKTNN